MYVYKYKYMQCVCVCLLHNYRRILKEIIKEGVLSYFRRLPLVSSILTECPIIVTFYSVMLSLDRYINKMHSGAIFSQSLLMASILVGALLPWPCTRLSKEAYFLGLFFFVLQLGNSFFFSFDLIFFLSSWTRHSFYSFLLCFMAYQPSWVIQCQILF